jgi:hypothetical protein
MAIAETSSIIAPLPREGLSLKATITYFVGPDLLAAYFAARDACRGFPLQIAGSRSLTADEQRQSAQRDELWQACITPPLEAWNSNKLDAAGSRGDQLAKPELIPPPARTAWNFRVLDLDRSIIRDPKGGKIFGFRFFEHGMGPVASPSPVSIVGLVEVIDRGDDDEPAHYRHIRDLADAAFPKGWKHRRQVVVLKGVADECTRRGEPVPERQMLLRALGYRKN